MSRLKEGERDKLLRLDEMLAAALFGTEENLVRVDMSGYQERHTVSRLVGARPGYVGPAVQEATMEAQVVTCERCGRKNRVPPDAPAGSPRCGQCHAPLPWLAHAGHDNFADVVEKSTIPVVVDLWAPWCGPCRMVSPALEQVARELAGKLKLVKVNVDEAPKLSERFSVQAVPTLLVIREGRTVARQAGAAPAPCSETGWNRLWGLQTRQTGDEP